MKAKIMGMLVGLAMVMAFALPASAAVSRHGVGTMGSRWELEVEDEGRYLDVEFDVNTTRAGQAWRIVLSRDGSVFFKGVRTTVADGDVEVERMIADRSGADRIVGRAVNLVTGEVCRGVATI